jgi:hypothetical protein
LLDLVSGRAYPYDPHDDFSNSSLPDFHGSDLNMAQEEEAEPLEALGLMESCFGLQGSVNV